MRKRREVLEPRGLNTEEAERSRDRKGTVKLFGKDA